MNDRVVIVRCYSILGALSVEVSSTRFDGEAHTGQLEYRTLLSADAEIDATMPDLLETLAEALFEGAKQLRWAAQEIDGPA